MPSLAVNTLPFWSMIGLSADLRLVPGALTRVLFTAGTKRRAFSYKQGDGAVPALEGDQATERDTILVKATETRGGARYHIKGISVTPDGLPFWKDEADATGLTVHDTLASVITPAPGSDANITPEDLKGLTAFMVNMLMANFKMDLKVDGTKRTIELGPVTFYNAVGGLVGHEAHSIGQPFAMNYYEIPEGIDWNPSGAKDSNMVVEFVADRTVIVPQYVSADGINPATHAAYGAELNLQKSGLGRNWCQRWLVNFHGQEISPTSDVS